MVPDRLWYRFFACMVGSRLLTSLEGEAYGTGQTVLVVAGRLACTSPAIQIFIFGSCKLGRIVCTFMFDWSTQMFPPQMVILDSFHTF